MVRRQLPKSELRNSFKLDERSEILRLIHHAGKLLLGMLLKSL